MKIYIGPLKTFNVYAKDIFLQQRSICKHLESDD